MTHTKWILLAEDDVQTAELSALALDGEASAFDVVTAHDGVETLDCLYRRGRFRDLEGGHPVVVLLDLKMPKLDGLEVLCRVKSDSGLKHILVVMLTSSREQRDVLNCYQLGANSYVVKPVDFGRFSKVIRLVGEFWTSVNEPAPVAPAEISTPQPLPATA
jgi:CheY-like chemotaxis protein